MKLKSALVSNRTFVLRRLATSSAGKQSRLSSILVHRLEERPRALATRAHTNTTDSPTVRILGQEGYKKRVEEKFDSHSATYDSPEDTKLRLCEELLSRASLRPGQGVLDVACGTGAASIPAAITVGPRGPHLSICVFECFCLGAARWEETQGHSRG